MTRKFLIFGVMILFFSCGVAFAQDDKPADITAKFFDAVYEGDYQNLKKMLEDGIGVNTRDEFGQTALHVAQDEEIVKLLLEYKADVNAKENDFGMTPIFFQGPGIAGLLIKAGAEVNASSSKGIVPLVWYSYSDNLEGIKLLLDNGAVCDEEISEEMLRIARMWNFQELTEFLNREILKQRQ